jgi:hypothetical protein
MAQENDDVELQGIVFHDLDGSGFQEEGEPGLAEIELTLQSGEQSQIVVTNEEGLFTALVVPGIWLLSLPEGSEWLPVNEIDLEIEVTGEEAVLSIGLGLVPVPDESTPTPEPEATEAVDDGTPEPTAEDLFVEEADDGVELPLILPESGVSLAPVVVWGLGFGLLIVVGTILIMIGRRGGLK